MITKHIAATVLSFTLAAAFLMAAPIRAEECSTNYGGSTTCIPTDLTIDKQIQDPVTGGYVDNAIKNKHNKSDRVNFRLIVKNTTNSSMHKVTVTDTMPDLSNDQHDKFLYIDEISIDPNSHQATIEIASDHKSLKVVFDELKAGEQITVYVMTHFVGPYPKDDTACWKNRANVTAEERSTGDYNLAEFCLVQKVQGAAKLPTAGAQDFLMILPFIGSGLGGLALIQKKK